jgi:16S rRNA (guanine527-N7)-methyltransferase
LAVLAWPDTAWVLADASAKRCGVLADAVDALDLADRVVVVHARAEDLGRKRRGEFSLVTARSFASPSITAECGLPLCRADGVVLVSEPPTGSDQRWPVDGLAQLGGVLEGVAHGIAMLAPAGVVPERYPRRPGIPAKRPLF